MHVIIVPKKSVDDVANVVHEKGKKYIIKKKKQINKQKKKIKRLNSLTEVCPLIFLNCLV